MKFMSMCHLFYPFVMFMYFIVTSMTTLCLYAYYFSLFFASLYLNFINLLYFNAMSNVDNVEVTKF